MFRVLKAEPTKLRGGFKHFFVVHPENLGEIIQFDEVSETGDLNDKLRDQVLITWGVLRFMI